MFQIRIHGRGGQGVVSASEMLSIAAFEEGNHSQSFPSFGSERMGAPVQAFARIDDKKISLREPVMEPDLLIIQDPTLFHAINVFEGLKKDGYVLINSAKSIAELGIESALDGFHKDNVVCIPATELALKHIKRPTPNTVLLGGFAAICDSLMLESLNKAISKKFKGKIAEANINAATAGYNSAMAILEQNKKQAAEEE